MESSLAFRDFGCDGFITGVIDVNDFDIKTAWKPNQEICETYAFAPDDCNKFKERCKEDKIPRDPLKGQRPSPSWLRKMLLKDLLRSFMELAPKGASLQDIITYNDLDRIRKPLIDAVERLTSLMDLNKDGVVDYSEWEKEKILNIRWLDIGGSYLRENLIKKDNFYEKVTTFITNFVKTKGSKQKEEDVNLTK